MRIYLCGQKYFGQEVLRLLAGLGVEIAGVSAPLKTVDGRDDRLWLLAERMGLPLLPSGRLNARTLPEAVDLIVCAHSHDFIGAETLRKTKLGGIGYHPSLLPLHRGRDAVYWTLRIGDRITGGTVYWLGDRVDGGAIAAQDWCFVRPGDKPMDLWTRDLQPMGLRLIAKVIGDLSRGRIVAVPQDEGLATWEPSVGRPPIFRPDLLMIGPPPEGYEVISAPSSLKRALDLYAAE